MSKERRESTHLGCGCSRRNPGTGHLNLSPVEMELHSCRAQSRCSRPDESSSWSMLHDVVVDIEVDDVVGSRTDRESNRKVRNARDSCCNFHNGQFRKRENTRARALSPLFSALQKFTTVCAFRRLTRAQVLPAVLPALIFVLVVHQHPPKQTHVPWAGCKQQPSA